MGIAGAEGEAAEVPGVLWGKVRRVLLDSCFSSKEQCEALERLFGGWVV